MNAYGIAAIATLAILLSMVSCSNEPEGFGPGWTWDRRWTQYLPDRRSKGGQGVYAGPDGINTIVIDVVGHAGRKDLGGSYLLESSDDPGRYYIARTSAYRGRIVFKEPKDGWSKEYLKDSLIIYNNKSRRDRYPISENESEEIFKLALESLVGTDPASYGTVDDQTFDSFVNSLRRRFIANNGYRVKQPPTK